ncbi:non-homologous end-joining DNA ligase [Nitrobacter sp. Nb-311A]|uniref:non-homologous end-joining DNA ligase n=1 Tax=Nitrobacter sp. Nb-311A TaxID=314253 RepID=UPI001A943057|nr:non-homologous end-joining DNA ligase [Nitrobacter sp. Nb-311A]
MPGFIKPQLATLKARAPSGDQWLNEIKYDGYRVQLHASGGHARAYTRNGLDWTKRFAAIAKALDIPGQAIFDGEAVVIEESRTNFSELQSALAAGRQGRIEYYAFDLLYLDGYDLRAVAQIERKRLLKDLFDTRGLKTPLHYSEHIAGKGAEMFEHAAKLNWEGIVSKDRAAPYRSDRNEGWIKVKTAKRGTFPVVGFIKDPTGVAALYLGRCEGGELVYMGKVGTGWSRTASSKIRKQLDTAVTAKSPLTKPVRKPKATWVEPRFAAEVEYRDITSEGLLRQSSFKGLVKDG